MLNKEVGLIWKTLIWNKYIILVSWYHTWYSSLQINKNKRNLQIHKRCSLLNPKARDKLEGGIMLWRWAGKSVQEWKPKMIDRRWLSSCNQISYCQLYHKYKDSILQLINYKYESTLTLSHDSLGKLHRSLTEVF